MRTQDVGFERHQPFRQAFEREAKLLAALDFALPSVVRSDRSADNRFATAFSAYLTLPTFKSLFKVTVPLQAGFNLASPEFMPLI